MKTFEAWKKQLRGYLKSEAGPSTEVNRLMDSVLLVLWKEDKDPNDVSRMILSILTPENMTYFNDLHKAVNGDQEVLKGCLIYLLNHIEDGQLKLD